MPPTAEAAKAFNQQLRSTALAITGGAASDYRYGFLCECGCEQTVRMTLTEYDKKGGALRDGHRQPLG
jgi:hypothetical protein